MKTFFQTNLKQYAPDTVAASKIRKQSRVKMIQSLKPIVKVALRLFILFFFTFNTISLATFLHYLKFLAFNREK